MSNKTPIIAAIEKEQMNKQIPEFGPGDTVSVKVKVKKVAVKDFRPLRVLF